jgi:hypothetical protein
MATSGSGSSGPAADSTENQRSPSPPKYSMPEDARKKPSEYPNYWVRKTRSGHVVMMDDTKGNEHLTIQHRSGTMMQFLPDGALHISTNKGRYDTTFGEQRTKVTGSSDLTASGVSIRAKAGEAAGGGKVAVTADKDFELAASESATLVTNKMSVAAGEFLHMGSKSVVMNATEGMNIITTSIYFSTKRYSHGVRNRLCRYCRKQVCCIRIKFRNCCSYIRFFWFSSAY